MVLNGPEDLLQWVALGAFAAIHPAKQAGWVAEALVMGLLAGLAAGSLGLAGSVPLWANVAVLLTVGTLLVAGACIPFAPLGGLAAGIGLLHGVHAGADMATVPDKLAIAAGVGITAYVFMVVCLATLVCLSRRIEPLRVVTFRAFGSWVVAIALMLGASELVGHWSTPPEIRTLLDISRHQRLALHGPAERLRHGSIEVGDEALDPLPETLFGGEVATADKLANQDGEPNLDLIDPRGMLGREVERDPVTGIAQKRLACRL